jgi:hypothetical protein
MQTGDPWVKILRVACEKPEFYIGPRPIAHLIPITQLLSLTWETKAFVTSGAATLAFSRTQCLARCEIGPLISQIEGLMDWENSDILFDDLLSAGRRLVLKAREEEEEWLEPFRSPTFGFGQFGAALYLADRGLLAIRTRAGLWCQAYERGWPTTAPVLLQNDSPVGMVMAAALSPEIFTGLPYTSEQVEAAVPKAAQSHVRLEYRPTDDLVTEHILRPAHVRDWL